MALWFGPDLALQVGVSAGLGLFGVGVKLCAGWPGVLDARGVEEQPANNKQQRTGTDQGSGTV